jgi:hypothetical protein
VISFESSGCINPIHQEKAKSCFTFCSSHFSVMTPKANKFKNCRIHRRVVIYCLPGLLWCSQSSLNIYKVNLPIHWNTWKSSSQHLVYSIVEESKCFKLMLSLQYDTVPTRTRLLKSTIQVFHQRMSGAKQCFLMKL